MLAKEFTKMQIAYAYMLWELLLTEGKRVTFSCSKNKYIVYWSDK